MCSTRNIISSGRGPGSGRKKPIPSLHYLCILKLLSNHQHLKDIPQLSLYYHLIKPVFFKLTKQQLLQAELNDPNLINLTDEIWSALVVKMFPGFKQGNGNDVIHEDENKFSSKRELYMHLEQQQELKKQRAVEKLRARTKKLEIAKNSNQIEIIDHVPNNTAGFNSTSSRTLPTQFKSSMLQKISKECTNKEKKFNHDLKFSSTNNMKKRLYPSVASSSSSSSSAGTAIRSVPRSTTTSSATSTSSSSIPTTTRTPQQQQQRPLVSPLKRARTMMEVPITKRVKPDSTTQQQRPQAQSQPPRTTQKKSSIFVKLSGIKGQ